MLRIRDRLRGRTFLTVLAACGASLLLLAPSAFGNTYKVTSASDAAGSEEASPGDGDCESVNGPCTLRAAIEEGNAGGDNDLIQFGGSVRGQTITVTGSLPTIDDEVAIDGCALDPGHVGPCVGLRNTDDTEPGLAFETVNVLGSKVKGLAITNTYWGVRFDDPDVSDLVVKNNRFGIQLNGDVEANDFGIHGQGDGAELGGDTSAERNVIAASAQAGIRIEGGDENDIQGNRFGTRPDGSVPAEPGDAHENDENIEIVGMIANDATENEIGATVSSSRAATAKCDGVCNLIVNAVEHGVDVSGEGAGELPAEQTTIAGNYIGLSRGGSSDKGNGSRGIEASSTDGTTIGGASSRDRNFIAGNDANAINAGSATALAIMRNYIGFDYSGSAAVPNGVAVQFSGGTFERNRVGGNGSTPGLGLVLIDAVAADVVHNTFGVGTGGQHRGFSLAAISITFGAQKQIGGPTEDEANTIGNGGLYGVVVTGGDGNDIEGNHIGTDPSGTQDHGNGTAGVRIVNSGADFALGNDVSLNLISNSGEDAVQILNDGNDDNFAVSNIGKNNGGGSNDLFIDLVGTNGFGNGASGPNGGIEAPVVSTVENSGDMTVTGTSAAPDGTEVQIYRTKSAAGESPSRIEAFVGIATVISGAWNTTFAHQPSGQRITALQRDDTTGFGSSELALGVGY